jgi:hypothetical protein
MYKMSSVGALLVGTPAKINPDLLSGSGVLVDSVNGLHGDVLLAAGAGMSVGVNTMTNTVTYTNAAPYTARANLAVVDSTPQPLNPIPAGKTSFTTGAVINGPAGLYLVSFTATFGADALAGTTVGAGDFVECVFSTGEVGRNVDLSIVPISIAAGDAPMTFTVSGVTPLPLAAPLVNGTLTVSFVNQSGTFAASVFNSLHAQVISLS